MKTSELQGSALDWAVAKCEGIEVRQVEGVLVDPLGLQFSPSIDWSYGGMVIERHCINLFRLDPKTEEDNRFWLAHVDGIYCRYGVSALIAAMRCYVRSQLGDEVKVPEEMLDENN